MRAIIKASILLLVTLCCEFYVFETVAQGFHGKEGYLKIELKRQKTPFEQHLNAPDLSQYGINNLFELDKKHKNKSTRTNDSIALYRYLDNEFYAEIIIGHPGQKLNVAIDTAWTTTWVLSSRCSNLQTIGCWFHNTYDHGKSSEWKKDGRPYIANEGKYNFTGFYSYDNISIAHSNVTAMSFVEMVTVPYTNIFSKTDGVIGFGLQTTDYQPLFYKLLSQKKIKNPLFSIYLSRDRQSKRGGNVILGMIEKRHIHQTVINGKPVPDKINYIPVDAANYWRFTVNKGVLNSSEQVVVCQNGCKAFIDTSTNSITGPPDEIDAIHTTIGAKPFLFNRYTVECDTVNKLPKFWFVINGINYELKGPNYTVRMSWRGLAICLSAFVPGDLIPEQDVWVLGGAFLAEYYTIYNVYDKTLGIVKAA